MMGNGFVAKFCIVAALLLVLSGCSVNTSFKYEPIPVEAPPQTSFTVGVEPLADSRPPRAYPSWFARIWLTYVPLLPYVKASYERLDETYVLHHAKHGKDIDIKEYFSYLMCDAIAADLAKSDMFKDVKVVADEQVSDFDFVLAGELKSTPFDRSITSYMFGAPGVLLWIIPMPIGKNEAAVNIDLKLKDRDGKEVWTYTLTEESRKLFTMYHSVEYPTTIFGLEITSYGSNNEGIDPESIWAYHASALRKGMAGAKRSLAAFLASEVGKNKGQQVSSLP